MIELPDAPRRADIRGFALSLGLFVTIVSGAAAALAGASLPFAWAAFCGAGAAAVLAGSDTVASRTYVGWNQLARLVSRGARLWITSAAFLAMAVAGRAGSRLPWRTPPGPRSGWIEKPSLEAGAFSEQGREAARDPGVRGWLGALARWGARDHGWVWGLLPFLALLALLHRGDVRAPTDRNYTLY